MQVRTDVHPGEPYLVSDGCRIFSCSLLADGDFALTNSRNNTSVETGGLITMDSAASVAPILLQSCWAGA